MSKFRFLQFKCNTPKHRPQNHVFEIKSKILIFVICPKPYILLIVGLKKSYF